MPSVLGLVIFLLFRMLFSKDADDANEGKKKIKDKYILKRKVV
jgi:hypothetical protein